MFNFERYILRQNSLISLFTLPCGWMHTCEYTGLILGLLGANLESALSTCIMNHHWFRSWLATCLVAIHHLNQLRHIVVNGRLGRNLICDLILWYLVTTLKMFQELSFFYLQRGKHAPHPHLTSKPSHTTPHHPHHQKHLYVFNACE